MTYGDWGNVALAAAYAREFWLLAKERRELKAAHQRCSESGDKLENANRAIAALFDQLTERYPDDADIERCRAIYAGTYAQH